MNRDEELRTILKSALPDVQASDGFTERTVRRLSKGRRPGRRWQLVCATAGALLLLAIAIPVYRHLDRSVRDTEVRQELEQLRAEHEKLAARLASIRDEAEDSPQLLYLGGTDSANYVVDLRRLARKPAAPPTRQATF